MAFETLDRSPPPFFRQGPSAAARLALYAALSVLAMAMDTRWNVAGPLRRVLTTATEPLVWVARLPGDAVDSVTAHFQSLAEVQDEVARLQRDNTALALRAAQAEQFGRDNAALRRLLQLRATVPISAQAAQVVAEAGDPYSRRLFIDKGALAGVAPGSPVMDESGLIGQVTDVEPLGSRVTLITDRESSVPVQDVRTGRRGVLVGNADATRGSLELMWQAADADLRPGDMLVTSGIDGVYPAGLAVARVTAVQPQPDTPFARVPCTPMGRVAAGSDVLVLKPLAALAPAPRPPAAAPRHPRKR